MKLKHCFGALNGGSASRERNGKRSKSIRGGVAVEPLARATAAECGTCKMFASEALCLHGFWGCKGKAGQSKRRDLKRDCVSRNVNSSYCLRVGRFQDFLPPCFKQGFLVRGLRMARWCGNAHYVQGAALSVFQFCGFHCHLNLAVGAIQPFDPLCAVGVRRIHKLRGSHDKEVNPQGWEKPVKDDRNDGAAKRNHEVMDNWLVREETRFAPIMSVPLNSGFSALSNFP